MSERCDLHGWRAADGYPCPLCKPVGFAGIPYDQQGFAGRPEAAFLGEQPLKRDDELTALRASLSRLVAQWGPLLKDSVVFGQFADDLEALIAGADALEPPA
jgi:hypothetical protein